MIQGTFSLSHTSDKSYTQNGFSNGRAIVRQVSCQLSYQYHIPFQTPQQSFQKPWGREEDKYRVSTNNWDQSSWREKSTYASTQYGSKYSSNYRKTLEPKQNGSCNFCLNNNMLDYQSHTLKTNDGRVTCPRLRSYRCPLCGVSGDKAHTIKYCPSRSSSRH